MKNPQAAAFVRDVMARVGVKNPTELSKFLGPPWTSRDQQRKLYKWHEGSAHPNGPSTIALIRAAGLLREDEGAAPVSAPKTRDPLQELRGIVERQGAATTDTLEDLERQIEQIHALLEPQAGEATGDP